MTKGYETTVKTKKLDKESSMKITKNDRDGRFFVAFSSNDGKLLIEKSFQDNLSGNKAMEEFVSSIKSLKDIRKYFGLE